MITRQLTGDISVFTVAGGASIATASNVKFKCPVTLVEGRGIAYEGGNPQAVEQECIISTTQMSDIDSCTRVASIDISALTLGGVDYLAYLLGGSLSGSFSMEEMGGVGNYWKYSLPMIPKISGSIQLSIPDSATANAVRDILAAHMDATIADAISARNLELSITINGVVITVPFIVQDDDWQGEDGKKQILTLTLESKDCGTGLLSSPAGTSTLLEKALNAYRTAVTIVFKPKATNSVSFSGEYVYDSWSFNFNRASIISTDYTWRSHGPVTPTPTA